MSTAQLIEGALSGAIKVADIDPSLQWGALGAGIGGAGGLVKSLASGGSLKDILKQTLGGAALGGGVGLSGAAGAKILGAQPPKLTGILEPKKEYKGDFGSAAGTGILGAGGLLAGAGIEEKRDRHDVLKKFLAGGGTGADLYEEGEASLKHNDDLVKHLKDQVAKGEISPDQMDDLLKSSNKDVAHADLLLRDIKAKMKAAPGAPDTFMDKLTGRSDTIRKFLAQLEAEKASTTPLRQTVAQRLSDELLGAGGALSKSKRFKPSPRATAFLKKFKNPKNLALAAGGIGLGTYGLTGLGEKIWGKKD